MNNEIEKRGGAGWRLALSALVLAGGVKLSQDLKQGSRDSNSEPTPVTTPTPTPRNILSSSYDIELPKSPIPVDTKVPTSTFSKPEKAITAKPAKKPVLGEESLLGTNQGIGLKDSIPDTVEEIKEPTIYTVKEDDTLETISRQHNNIPEDILYNMNSVAIGEDPNSLKPGTELLIIHWGPAEASRNFARRKTEETIKQGGEITWVYTTLGEEAIIQDIAEVFDVDADKLAEMNGIDDQTEKLPKGYYLMIPADEGFAFSDIDRQEGRRFKLKPGISMDAIWWENSTGQEVIGPGYPNVAYMVEPYSKEYWIEASWSTADELSEDYYVPETVTDTPANRVWETIDKEGNITQQEREGFLVYGKKRICHTEYRKAPAGEWVFTKSISF